MLWICNPKLISGAVGHVGHGFLKRSRDFLKVQNTLQKPVPHVPHRPTFAPDILLDICLDIIIFMLHW
jgi:hypothetical protein